jgi:hypothetical protein
MRKQEFFGLWAPKSAQNPNNFGWKRVTQVSVRHKPNDVG